MLSEQINADLQAFEENPAEFMDRLPAKAEEQAGEGGAAAPLFDPEAIAGRQYVAARDALRQQATSLDQLADGREAFAANDQADGFVDSLRHSGLQSMEQNGLMSARLDTSPWSDDYWGIYLGILGRRYADPHFPNSTNWKANRDYIQNNPAAAVLENGNAAAINQLAPAEKYDILIGDPRFSLTAQMWKTGEAYYLRNGRVETWMGICHGWSPAAYMLSRPSGTATVLAANGKTWLTFYPSDIKALASLLWANANPQVRFIGGRCNDLNPQKDPGTGRILAKDCFDTNPGTWHLAVVNQIGASRRSMVMDATYDYEVWNQPVLGYSYSYFNPASNVAVNSLADASIAKSAFQNDKFAKYRSAAAEMIVGIAMDVSYIAETSPTQNSADSPARDRVVTVRYLYDLELDFAGKIIGGEWRQNAHPDFLWTPPPGSKALSPWERQTPLAQNAWQLNQPIPAQWQQIAAVTSEYSKLPLAAIVEQLIAFANS